MTTNQEGRQAAIRDTTSSVYGVAADWHALFDDAGISAGTFNERLLAWINAELSASYSNLVSAMQAYAEDAGYDGWEDMATLVLAMNGAETLLDGETQGLAFDFTDQSALIIDTGTPANNYDSSGYVTSGALVGPGGKLTYTSPSNKICRQASGFFTYGAHNLQTYSEQFDNAEWVNGPSGTAASPVVTANHGTAPDGSATADRLVLDLQGGTTTSDICLLRNTVTVVSGSSYVCDVWMKASDGSSAYTVQIINADGTATSCDVTGTWTKFTTGAVTATASGGINFGIRVRGGQTPTNSDVADLHVWGAHVYRYPANTDYIKTTSAAKYALPLEYSATDGSSLGLLVEEARTNLLTYSSQIDNAAWTKTRSTISANAAVAPNGLSHADKLVEDNSLATTHYTQRSETVSGTTTYTASVYAKAGEKSWIRMTSSGAGGGNSHFDLANGSVGTVTTTSAMIEDVGNGWYRCSHTWTTGAITSSTFQIYIAEADNDVTFDGDSSSGVYLWNAQIEAGSFPTSPIITYGAAASRLADNISIATTAFPFSTTVGSLFCYATSTNATAASDGTTSPRVMTISNNNTSVQFSLMRAATTNTPTAVQVNGASNTATSGTWANAATKKMAAALDASELAVAFDGSSGAPDATVTDLTGASVLQVGGVAVLSSPKGPWNGVIKQVVYVPRKKSDAELQAETA